MIESFSIYSDLNGSSDTLIFNRENADFLIDDNGVNWGEVTSQIYTNKTIDNIGSTITAIETVEPRPITITGWVVGTEEQMKSKKKHLSDVITPQATIRVQIPNPEDVSNPYYIDTQLTSSVKFSQNYDENNEVMCQFTFTLSAAYPFFCLDRFYDESDYRAIQNLGSIPVGVQISMELNSSASPYVTISRSGHESESFALSGEYVAGDIVEVDTRKGARKVLVNGSRGFKGLSSSKWIQVPPSKTNLAIRCNATVLAIRFSEAHTVLEGM